MKKRDYGIDLLRLACMGLIVLHHLLNHGGLLFAFPVYSNSGMLVHLLNAFTRCAVNGYALISGYVLVNARFRPSRFLSLWLQVVFYGVLAIVCIPLFFPETVILASDWLKALLPVSTDHYWYFTCYAAIFCLSPVLNQMLRSLSRRQAMLFAGALIFLFSILPTLAQTDPFQLQAGYHTGWLMIVYLLGGILRLHGLGWLKRWKITLPLFLACILISWASRLYCLSIDANHPASYLLLNYDAPTTLLCALILLALFQGMRLPDGLTKAVSTLSPLTFGVYLIHDNPLVRKHLIKMRMTALAGLNPVLLILGLFACWAGLYAVCLLMEWLRTKLFALLRVPALCEHAEKRLFQWADRRFPEADA